MFALETSVKEEVLEHIRWVCRHTKSSMGHLCDTIFKEKLCETTVAWEWVNVSGAARFDEHLLHQNIVFVVKSLN